MVKSGCAFRGRGARDSHQYWRSLFDDEGNLVPINRPPVNWKRFTQALRRYISSPNIVLPGVGYWRHRQCPGLVLFNLSVIIRR